MNDTYSAFAEFYDRLMDDVDYTSVAKYYDGLIREHTASLGILLDLACGTGTLSALLADKGWDVIAVDSSSEMLSKTTAHSRVSYICQDMNELDLYGTIDAAVCSFDGLNHLTDQSALMNVLERVSLFMNPEGVFVFDVNTIHKHETILGQNTFIKECDDVFCVWQNDYQGDGIVNITLDIFAENDEQYTRHTVEITETAYQLDTIHKLCKQSGFDVVGEYDFMTKNPGNEKSEKVVFVCKAQKKVV